MDEKLKTEIQAKQKNLKELQDELAKLNSKIEKDQPVTPEDTKFISELGWLTALAVTVATIAESLS